MIELDKDELHEICELTIKLTALRQNECKHLCIENSAPELFHKLLTRFVMHKQGMICVDSGIDSVVNSNGLFMGGKR